MGNAGLEEARAGITIAGRNINNVRYADDTTLMAEWEEKVHRLLIKVKEKSEKVQITRIMAAVSSLSDKYMGKQWHTLF